MDPSNRKLVNDKISLESVTHPAVAAGHVGERKISAISFLIDLLCVISDLIGVMDALLFVITLEVMLLQMRILAITSKAKHVLNVKGKDLSEVGKMFREVGKILRENGIALKGNETTALRKFPDQSLKSKREKLVRDKLTRDRKLVKEIILRTLKELANDGEYSTLQQGVKMLKKKSILLVTLRSKYEELKRTLANLTMEIQNSRQQWATDLNNSDFKAAMLRDSVKDKVFNARIQHAYADRWLCARAEAHELQMQKDTTSAPAPKSEHEDCVHNELVRAYALQIQESENLLKYWKARYSQDTADIEIQLREQCEKLRITLDRREELEKLYKLHEGEMRAWSTFKKERTARLAREERLRSAATRVQAWWRGVMVRRALGTFRYLRNIKKPAPKLKKK